MIEEGVQLTDLTEENDDGGLLLARQFTVFVDFEVLLRWRDVNDGFEEFEDSLVLGDDPVVHAGVGSRLLDRDHEERLEDLGDGDEVHGENVVDVVTIHNPKVVWSHDRQSNKAVVHIVAHRSPNVITLLLVILQ